MHVENDDRNSALWNLALIPKIPNSKILASKVWPNRKQIKFTIVGSNLISPNSR